MDQVLKCPTSSPIFPRRSLKKSFKRSWLAPICALNESSRWAIHQPDGFWFDQGKHEWVVLLKGAARLRFENADEPIEMLPGSFVNIPAHQRHRVEWTDSTQPTIWLAIHYGE